MVQLGEMGIEISMALKGIDYPASKQDLVQKAKDNNAGSELIHKIENLPDDRFNSEEDVQKSWEKERQNVK